MIRRLAAASAALLIASELCACSHGGAIACEPTARYAGAATAGPVRIPDDLNPPDETDSLRLPPNTGPTAQPSKPCLETPPGFYAEGAPSNPRGAPGPPRRNGANGPAPPQPRQAAPPPAAAPSSATAPGPAQPPAVAAPAPPPVATPAPPPTDAPPEGGDREITN